MNRLCFRPRPLKCFWRLKVGTDHSSFRIPFNGWWRITSVGGGGGSGATHSYYADPSEHGENGSKNSHLRYNPVITAPVVVGVKGLGGSQTDDLDFPPQRGTDGTDTVVNISGIADSFGGEGGRCAAEVSGLSPTKPLETYTFWIGFGSTKVGHLFGVYQDGGSVRAGTSDNAGQGAAGNSAPPPAGDGLDGSDGQIDFRLEG